MKHPIRVAIITVTVTAAFVLAALIAVLVTQSAAPEADPDGPRVIRSDSHVLDDGGADAVTVVEFLDFECEACGAFYPVVEDIRERFAGDITYVVRYFPLPGHTNSTNAALAAEASAQQGRFEDMYHRLFETQAEWGESQESLAHVFRGFAEELDLDMTAYDAAVADPATLARVRADFDEGSALGVRSTPTFFVDGELLVLQGWDDLPDAIERAVDASRR